jgi:hypothetical protein
MEEEEAAVVAATSFQTKMVDRPRLASDPEETEEISRLEMMAV